MAKYYKEAGPIEVIVKAIALVFSAGSLLGLCVLSTFDLPGDPPNSCPSYWERVQENKRSKANYYTWDKLHRNGSYTKSFKEYEKEIAR